MSGAVALLEACTTGSQGTSAADLTFVVWSYGVETIKDNIKKLEAKVSGLHVNFQDFAWTNFHDIIQGMTYQGKNYGIPYYADTWAFLYNEDHLKKAGISQPPTTWAELTQQSQQIKAKGIANYPVILLFAQDDPGSIEVWTSMVFSLTDGHLFDDSLNPVFNKAGSAAAKTVDWISGALNTTKILDPASLTSQEIPVVKSMESGAHTFTILETYNQAELNKSGSGPS